MKYEITTMKLDDDDYVFAVNNFPEKERAVEFYNNTPTTGAGFTFSLVSALYDAFSKEGRERRKLAELIEHDMVKNMIEERISVQEIMNFTGMSLVETENFLEWCDFNADFVKNISTYYLIITLKHKFEQYRKLYRGDKGKVYLE